MNTNQIRSAIVLASAIAVATLSGCHKKTAPPPPPPPPPPASIPAPTATITADPTSVDAGQSVILNWRTTNATSVTIDGIGPVNTSGTQTVAPTSSTDFHLTAKGDGGSTDATVRVTVRTAQAPAPAEDDMGSDAAFHQNVKDIFFDYDAYDLTPAGQSAAAAAASYLSSHQAIKVVVGGYCDSRGSAEYNLALGENRANAAKAALVNAGVSSSRIRVISYGKEKQFCTEQNESCWQQNRRAGFSIDR